MYKAIPRRLGKFVVPRQILEEQENARALMRDMFIVMAENNFASDTIKYYGIHPAFDIAEPGEELPEYKAKFHAMNADVVVIWEKVKD